MLQSLLFLVLLQSLDRLEDDLDALALAAAHAGLQFGQQPRHLIQVLQRLVFRAQRQAALEGIERRRRAGHGLNCRRELRPRFRGRNAEEKGMLEDFGISLGLALNGRNVRKPRPSFVILHSRCRGDDLFLDLEEVNFLTIAVAL